MPPKNKKRATNKQPIKKTLHDFFGTKVTNSSKASTAEVIVIDDSDDEVEVVQGPHPQNIPQKRRRLSPSSDPRTRLTQPQNPIISNELTTVITEHSAASVGFQVSFGAPILLSDEQPAMNLYAQEHPPLHFGEPMLLQQSSSSLGNDSPESKPELQSAFTSTREAAFDNWLNEDDEFRSEEDQSVQDNTTPLFKVEPEHLDVEESSGYEAANTMDPFESEIPTSITVAESLESSSSLYEEAKSEHPSKRLQVQGQVGSPASVSSQKLSTITSRSDAFSKMMSSIKENTAWQEASKNEKSRFTRGKGGNGTRTKAPFYKVLQGMPIAVDAFKYGAIPGVTAYFLTHAHSDHYTNLSSSWKHGPIYCSEGTANLIIHMLSVDPKWVHTLPMDKPVEIPDTQGVTVTLIEANHCPGSCLFFFEGRQTIDAGDSTFKSSHVGSPRIFRYLHCGDFRASPRHVLHPAVKGKDIDHVYLDTTYLDPRYTFPPQPLVIDACAELARRVVCNIPSSDKASSMISWLLPSTKGKEKEQPLGKPLVVVGTYSIGKERIVKAIARSLNSKVYCDSRKAAILRCQVDCDLDKLLTSDPKEASVHLVPLNTINIDQLKIYLERFKGSFDRVIGFRPTGWTYSQAAGTGTNDLLNIADIISKCCHKGYTYSDLQLGAKSTPTLQVYAVPYSEHSSFFELTCFAMSFRWNKMIATVNVGSESSRNKMNRWIHKWEAEHKRKARTDVVPYRHLDYW
ncbi:hypothetical protein CVT24_006276 [Panaeolus cyanescens]|uniref:DNA repair metallo-beta-lactamase domain-containing protein n=1 Tax=Panaeolus cyanescens TaxID=181874 RepID=A0A409V8J7_9AGAR|nr:hypothetical protein CVT24_006276 [Panaeolus cyanescens]